MVVTELIPELFYKLRRKIKPRHRSRRATLLMVAILTLIVVQLLELLLASGVLSSSYGPAPVHYQVFWMVSSLTALGISLVMLGSRLLISNEAARSEAIADRLTDAVLFIEGNMATYANTLARELLGQQTTPVKIKSEIAEVLEQARKSHTPVLHESTLDGRKHYFLVSKVQPALGRTQEPEREMFVFQDVTFLRENEEAKVNFIGALSHEIKTPVTSLAMALAMLDRNGYDEELVRIANADVGRLRILLEDLLNASKLKIVRNPNSLHKRDTNLSALLHQTVKTASVPAEQKGVRLVNRMQAGGQILANIDPTKITWVLSTLLTDAIRQTPAGGTVCLTSTFEGTTATFEVLYQRRLDSLGPTGHAIVRDIIEAHAGRFGSLHRTNHESLFRFTIHAYVNVNKTQKGTRHHEAHLTG